MCASSETTLSRNSLAGSVSCAVALVHEFTDPAVKGWFYPVDLYDGRKATAWVDARLSAVTPGSIQTSAVTPA